MFKKLSLALHLFIFAFIIIAIVLIFTTKMSVIGHDTEEMYDYSSGWTYQDGSKASLTELKRDKVITITNKIDDRFNEYCLCLHSKNINFSVYVNDEKCYDYHPTFPKLFGKSYGNAIHCINVTDVDKESEIKIIAEPIFADGTEFFKKVYFAKAGQYTKFIVNQNMTSFLLCVITFIFGFCLLLMGLIFYFSSKNDRLQPIVLGLIAMLCGSWCAMETLFFQVFTDNSAACHFINYTMLILLPAPAIYLIAYMTNNVKSIGKRIVTVATVTDFILQVSVTLLTDKDYHDLLIINHSIVVFMVLSAFILVFKSYKDKTINDASFIIVILAFLVLAMSGVVDIIRFHQNPAGGYGTIVRLGVFIFVVMLGVYEIHKLLQINKESGHADDLRRMAHEDGLTLLENRLAFNEYERELVYLEEGHYIIVQYDINNLKKVNDHYGHIEGDRHIMGAANLIKTCFGEYGRIFRTGGDEFIAILDGKNIETRFERAELAFDKMIDEYNEEQNPPIKMEIAYGAADYICGQNSLGNAEELADKLMYEHKIQLKSRATL